MADAVAQQHILIGPASWFSVEHRARSVERPGRDRFGPLRSIPTKRFGFFLDRSKHDRWARAITRPAPARVGTQAGDRHARSTASGTTAQQRVRSLSARLE